MTHRPTKGAVEEALRNPGGWVYEIRGNFRPDEDVPATAIVGAWKVNGEGRIIGDFIPNPNFIEPDGL